MSSNAQLSSLSLDPFETSREIADSFRRYLKTTFYFRDPEFRIAFERILDTYDLFRGPYLEATHVYRRSDSAAAIVSDIIGTQLDNGFSAALLPNRRLYSHQEESLRRLAAGRNVVVATGTGSGKTEAYLLPILLQLYREALNGRRSRGVRALILYPMNALANDQRRRLGECCRVLEEQNSVLRLTFGRYTGEMPENEHDHRRHARDRIASRLPGEMVLRREIREAPPDILLTNYSMLEYLLLRPQDSPLFDGGRGETWRFLVLDEAHLYRGAKGMEVAMLLRRLRQRIVEGGGGDLQCVATSATLGGGDTRRSELASFANRLFGANFAADDVVVEETIPLPEEVSFAYLPVSFIQELSHLITRSEPTRAIHVLCNAARQSNIPYNEDDSVEVMLHRVLSRDRRAVNLRRRLVEPIEVRALGEYLFEELPAEEERMRGVFSLANLLSLAQDPESRAPLLSARYHLFIRGLESAFIRYWPERQVILTRPGSESDGAWFEVALCRECGQHYLVGKLEGGRFVEAQRAPWLEGFSITFLRPIEDETSVSVNETLGRLCLRCGTFSRAHARRSPDQPSCGHGNDILVSIEETRERRPDQMRSCGLCNYRGLDPVREIVHGNDGPNAVIATTLHHRLPPDRRKILAFADGRQEAAFFAWYAEQSYSSLRDRNIILRALRNLVQAGHEEIDLQTLSLEVASMLRHYGIAAQSEADTTILRNAWIIVLRECLTDERRISLEGVALAHWYPNIPDEIVLPESLMQPPWAFDEEGSRIIVRLLLDTLRTDFAMSLIDEPGIRLDWQDLMLQARQGRVEIGGQGSVTAWDGPRTRRVRYLCRVLEQLTGGEIPERERIEISQQILRELWEAFGHAGGRDRLLLRSNTAKVANFRWWRVRPVNSGNDVYRCNVCGRLQFQSIAGVCPRYACPGRLQSVRIPTDDLASNHYRQLYQTDIPPLFRAEEHTAQIGSDKAHEYQEEFERGDIHLLSCSTTFELGVDLGDLDTIFLRNVPPEAFNYAQRVGRAGRRQGKPGFAVTYCRRQPHDLVNYFNPANLLSGRMGVPALTIRNEKIALRHVAAIALASFFLNQQLRFQNVEALLGDWQNPHAASDIISHLQNHCDAIETRLRAVMPHDIWLNLGLEDGTWIDRLCGPDSPLAQAEHIVSEDYRTVVRLEQQYSSERRHKDADWARRRADTIAGEYVISFLSRKAVIPKYGFPVDVVELDLQAVRSRGFPGSGRFESSDVSLQRDLAIAIAEFAPQAKVIANKKVWTSHGLKVVAGSAWPRWNYRHCRVHGTFEIWPHDSEAPGDPCCDRVHTRMCVDPMFGFISQRGSGKAPSRRLERLYTTRPYFSRMPGSIPERINMGGIAMATRASPGYLFVLCEGKRGNGFRICTECGAGFTNLLREDEHKSPYGTTCRGRLEPPVALGHEFLTDVLLIRFFSEGPCMEGNDEYWFIQSLSYAMLQGAAAVLEVPLMDINVTVKYTLNDEAPEIVLYDNVPGGAGLVARLESPDVFRSSLDAARDRVAGRCGCASDTSCYGCLRHYGNQFAHPHMKRGPVLRFLEEMLERWD